MPLEFQENLSRAQNENSINDYVNLDQGENITDKNFGNYFPFCGNEILDNGEGCDDGENNGQVCKAGWSPVQII